MSEAVTPEIATPGLDISTFGTYTTGKNGINFEIAPWELYRLPYKHTLSADGVFVEKMCKEEGEKELVPVNVPISRTPFIICSRTEQLEDGTIYYTIRYGHGKEQKEFVCTYSDINGQKAQVKKTLAAHGINVPDNDKLKDVIEYISLYIHEFNDRLHTEKAVTNNGWNEDCTLFAMGKTGITKDKICQITTAVKDPKHNDALTTGGDMKGWIHSVHGVFEYNLTRFMFYDSMTAPLIKPLGQENIVTGHNGPTGTFKTGLAWVTSSALGNPKDLEFKADSTANAVLAHAIGMCDMPIDIEEATDEKSMSVIASSIYTLSNGADKGRCTLEGKLRSDIKPFRTSARITTENPITDHINHVGGLVRAREQSEVLPNGLGTLTRATKAGIQKHYGHFFPIYVKHIMNNMGRLEVMFSDAYNKLEKVINVPEESRGMVERQAQAFALDIVAGILVEEVFKEIRMTSKTHEEVEEIVIEYFKKMVLNDPIEPVHIKVLREIVSWTSTTHEFIKNGEKNFSNTIAGEMTETEIKIIGSAFRKHMIEVGLSTNVKADFLREGLIDKENKTIKVNGDPEKGFIIKRKVMYEKLGLYDTENTGKNNIGQTMRFAEIIDTLSHATKRLGRKSVNPVALHAFLGYDVTEYLLKLEKMGRVVKLPNGDYV
jgi:uncharacterized protein (DUF927 family)